MARTTEVYRSAHAECEHGVRKNVGCEDCAEKRAREARRARGGKYDGPLSLSDMLMDECGDIE